MPNFRGTVVREITNRYTLSVEVTAESSEEAEKTIRSIIERGDVWNAPLVERWAGLPLGPDQDTGAFLEKTERV